MFRGESQIDFRTHNAIMTQRAWPPPTAPYYLRHSQIFDQINSFSKNFLNVFRIKKANCISVELSNVYLINLLISFFPLLLWITAKNRTKLKKLYELQNQEKHNTTNIQTGPDCSSTTAIMLVIFWIERERYFWLKEFIQRQT